VTGSRTGRVLMVFAHPDDETLLTGALIPKLIADRQEVHLLCVAPGDDADLVARMERASAELGISPVSALRFSAGETSSISRDGARMPPLANAPESAVGHLIEGRIAEINPSIIITHSPTGDYGHPDHAFCHRATVSAVEAMSSAIELYALAWPNFALSVNRKLGRVFGAFSNQEPASERVENLPVTHVHDVSRYLPLGTRAARHYSKEIARGPLPMRLLEAAPVVAQRLILGKARLSRIR
jgi:LmbE family N-acetylglucosaminyl deacetylase